MIRMLSVSRSLPVIALGVEIGGVSVQRGAVLAVAAVDTRDGAQFYTDVRAGDGLEDDDSYGGGGLTMKAISAVALAVALLAGQMAGSRPVRTPCRCPLNQRPPCAWQLEQRRGHFLYACVSTARRP